MRKTALILTVLYCLLPYASLASPTGQPSTERANISAKSLSMLGDYRATNIMKQFDREFGLLSSSQGINLESLKNIKMPHNQLCEIIDSQISSIDAACDNTMRSSAQQTLLSSCQRDFFEVLVTEKKLNIDPSVFDITSKTYEGLDKSIIDHNFKDQQCLDNTRRKLEIGLNWCMDAGIKVKRNTNTLMQCFDMNK